MSAIENAFTIFSGFLPMFGYLISQLPYFNNKKSFVIAESCLIGLFIATIAGAFDFADPVNVTNRTLILSEYVLFLAIMLPVFTYRYTTKKFSTVLGLVMILGFLLTELHELPAFIKMYLGMFDNSLALREYFVWYTPINHAYSVLAVFLAIRVGRLRMSVAAVLLSVLAFLTTCVLYPYIEWGVTNFAELAVRFVWFVALIIIFYTLGNYTNDKQEKRISNNSTQ